MILFLIRTQGDSVIEYSRATGTGMASDSEALKPSLPTYFVDDFHQLSVVLCYIEQNLLLRENISVSNPNYK